MNRNTTLAIAALVALWIYRARQPHAIEHTGTVIAGPLTHVGPPGASEFPPPSDLDILGVGLPMF